MECLQRVNAYVHVYSNVLDQEVPEYNLRIVDKAVPAGEHRGRFNAPVDADEIAVIFDTDKVKFRDLILNLKCEVLFYKYIMKLSLFFFIKIKRLKDQEIEVAQNKNR